MGGTTGTHGHPNGIHGELDGTQTGAHGGPSGSSWTAQREPMRKPTGAHGTMGAHDAKQEPMEGPMEACGSYVFEIPSGGS